MFLINQDQTMLLPASHLIFEVKEKRMIAYPPEAICEGKDHSYLIVGEYDTPEQAEMAFRDLTQDATAYVKQLNKK